MKTFIERKEVKRVSYLVLACALFVSIMAPGAYAAAQEKMLVPMGKTVGIQMSTEGAMVVGLSATGNGTEPSPSAVAGVVPGDLITALGSDKISGVDDFRSAVEKLDGNPVPLTVKRGTETLQFTLEPSMAGDGPELGLWLRDSISGIGTLTYYDPQTGKYGGLGHSINDVDSGMIMPLGSGEIVASTIVKVVKGAPGSPGELCGTFDAELICGNIMRNTSRGIFGELSVNQPSEEAAVPMGTESDISLGKATIFANISGTDVSEFEIEIVRVYRNDDDNRSMMIKVTDSRLLEATGGIVQGMSGSPIMQNGKLIGAVTHVLINDPTSGFAVSVEKMLESSEG